MSETEIKNPTQFQPGNTYGKGRPPGSRNATPLKEQFIKDMEEFYTIAISQDRLETALRAKALAAKAGGVFRTSKIPFPDIKSHKDMDTQQLQDFIDRLEEHDPALKKLKRMEDSQ